MSTYPGFTLTSVIYWSASTELFLLNIHTCVKATTGWIHNTSASNYLLDWICTGCLSQDLLQKESKDSYKGNGFVHWLLNERERKKERKKLKLPNVIYLTFSVSLFIPLTRWWEYISLTNKQKRRGKLKSARKIIVFVFIFYIGLYYTGALILFWFDFFVLLKKQQT